MKFYNRERELEILQKRILSQGFDFIYLLWKRRIWKTSIIKYLLKDILQKDFFYIFVERSDLDIFLKKQERYFFEKVWIKYNFESIEDFLDVFFNQNKIDILVIDEFQNFSFMDKWIFSIFQKKVDEYQNTNKKLIVAWSINSLMIKIFENAKEPLYKRANFNLFLKEFNLKTQIKILKDIFWKNYNHKILLDIYSIFWWVPYYLKLLFKQKYKEYDRKKLLEDLFFDEFAILKNEWKEILIEEFWQKYKRFFAILETIAKWKNKRNEIINELNIWTWEIDIYLRELKEKFDIIDVITPVLEKKKNITKYQIKDNFLNFWFKFIYSNKRYFELWLYEIILEKELKNFWIYLWFKFEALVKSFLIEKNIEAKLDFTFTEIWYWLDRKNNEIDIVFTDKKDNITFLECKLTENRINKQEEEQLKNNVKLFLDKHTNFKWKNIKLWFAIFDENELVKFKYF